jgi:DNA mismatch repair protein MutH
VFYEKRAKKMSLPYDDRDVRSIERYAKRLIGRSLRGVLDTNTIETIVEYKKTKGEMGKYIRDGQDNQYIVDSIRTKGDMGQLLEKYYFMYKPNNRSEPDFSVIGLELKSTPVVYDKGGHLRPKERLVLNIIDYMSEHKKDWDNSSFWHKNRSLLILFYLYEKDKSILDLLFKLAGVWEYPPEDLKIIKDDWARIVDKIRAGKAHEISEADTFYLGACRKGVGHGGDLRKQPFSKILAPQRAYSFKQKYMNTIIARWTGDITDEDIEPILKGSLDEYKDIPFDELVTRRFEPYLGMSIEEIHKRLNVDINPKAKNYYATLTLRILGVVAKKAEEFEKAGVIIRTIRLKHNNRPKEEISFPAFRYKEIIKEEWETSTLRSLLERKFFFVIYKYDTKGNLILRKATFWNMPYQDLENEVKRVWDRTIEQIKNGKADELPRITDSPLCHVRPHGANARDTDETPNGRKLVKKSFWLNASYIEEQVASDLRDQPELLSY